MSWLQRQAQIQKGKQIFAEHPVLGIGYTNFVAYNIEIDESQIEADRSLRNIDNRSSHNTYISWLAETGALGFGSMILFFLFILVSFWRKIHLLPDRFESGLLISFLGMLIYFYTIAAQMGTSTWIMYGIIAGGANALYAKKSGIKPKKLSK
jgi:O-antigen ligase